MTLLACVTVLATTTLTTGAARAADTTSTVPTTTPSAGKLEDLGHGVTKDSIKVGFAILDYDAISNFVDYERGDQERTVQVFVDAINQAGGVNGRKIVPYFKKYPPIPGRDPSPLSLCTSWTEDDGVFAVLGLFVDPTGQGPLCITKEHGTIHIGHQLAQSWIDEAPPGLLLTPDSTRESNAKVLVTLLAKDGKLRHQKVAMLADQSSVDRANSTVAPALRAQGVKLGSTAVLSITGTDTTAAQAQLDSFLEKWKAEGVTGVLMVGGNVTAKQFVEPMRAAMPKVTLMTDNAAGVLAQAQDEVAAGKQPNPYQGVLGVFGATDSERWAHKSKGYQRCIDTYQKATGQKVPGPDSPVRNAAGQRIDLYASISDFCGELVMFTTIADKVGPDLTIGNWKKTVDHFGKIDLVQTPIASLCKGKYAANDARRLVQFDSRRGAEGDWNNLTPLEDASGGQCAKQLAAHS